MRGKTDNNQAAIVTDLRALGLTVADLSGVGAGVPDLLVGGAFPCPQCRAKVRQNILLEIKSPDGVLTPAQKEFHLFWRGQLKIIRTIDEAIELTQKSQKTELLREPQQTRTVEEANSQKLRDVRRTLERLVAQLPK